MVLGIFEGIQFVLDSSSFTYVPFKKKQELRKQITDNGGTISYILTKKTNFVITADGKKTLSSYKGSMAMKYGVPVVHMDFVADCVLAGSFLDSTPHVVGNSVQEKEFSSGKISAGMKVKRKKNQANKTIQADLENQRIWVYKDPNGPQYPEKDYKIAKDMVLKKTDKNGEITQFFAIELHIVPSSVPCEFPRYRIFTHHGSLNLLKCNDKDDQIFKECYFSYTVEEALGIYVALNDKLTSPAHGFDRVWSCLSYKIGSDKMKEQCLDVQESSDGIPPILEVTSLVDYLWTEAVGCLSDTLSVPVESLKLQTVQEAEAVLVSMKECLDKNHPDGNEIRGLWKEFCQLVPHEEEEVVFSKSLIAEKQNLCQLIRDIVTVSESTSMSRVSSHIAKYKALHCLIEHLDEEEEEFQRIKEAVVSSLTDCSREFRVLNIFSLYRPVEDNNFTHHLDNKRLLYHASRVNNFVGILSRGLLLPKIVVDDLGGQRSDPGMLGSGIYFGGSASTSVKYSTRGSSGSRFMLINEVALGRTKRYRHFDKELTTAPEGYHSTHGVAESSQETSDFKDDEFVIYNTNQQRMRYLVEFSLDGEYVRKRHVDFALLSNLDQELEPLAPLQPDEDIDLTDVTSVVDPMSKVEAGLKGSGDHPVPLQAVHIRAKLLDLVAQVVVLQSYKNNSAVPIEAKYVFPLDDMAAVSGFEAFINGKHIIGEVKEKEQARKEYREAISQGHGAYLMDEETPDVFTVSVGNLPSNATVLIKITYIAELAVEGEKICFSLPGSVAPWKRTQALDDVTQTDVDTVRVEEETNTTIQVAIEMPFDIRSIESPTHAIRIKRTATKAVVELEPGHVMGDGFQLVIGLAEIHVPRMWVERHETKHDSEAGMLVFYPEFEAEDADEVEVLFCLDASCSMKGSSLKEAKKILQMCINFLPDNWLFNVIVFGSYHSELFIDSQQKTSHTVSLASDFIKSLAAQKGGTELWRVLQSLSLIPSMVSTDDHPRNVFIISDGHVTEESTTLALVRQGRLNSRVFTLGVGSTSNRHMLRALAQVGAGASEFFNSKAKSKWERKVKALLFKAGQPGLTSVSVTWQQHDSYAKAPVQAPHEIVSLFSGSRLVVYGLVSNCTQAFLTAEVNGREISTMVSTSDLSITRGKILHQLVARGLIKDWEEGNLDQDHTKHEIAKRDSKNYIISISKEFSIVSQFTSFIAVEKRKKDEKLDEGLGPSIQELVADEDVDIIPYVSWEDDRPPMTAEKEPTTEDEVILLLTKAKNIENVSVLQAEDLYKRACDLVVEQSQKRHCSEVVVARAFLLLSNFYSSICHDDQKGKAVIDLLSILAEKEEEESGGPEDEELIGQLTDIFSMETLRDIAKSPLHPKRSLILEIFPASEYSWSMVVDDYESSTTASTESSPSESDTSPVDGLLGWDLQSSNDEENELELDEADFDDEWSDEFCYSASLASDEEYEEMMKPARALKKPVTQREETKLLSLNSPAFEGTLEEEDFLDNIYNVLPARSSARDSLNEFYDMTPEKFSMDLECSAAEKERKGAGIGRHGLITPACYEEPSYEDMASDVTVEIRVGLPKKKEPSFFTAEAQCWSAPDDRQELEPRPSLHSEKKEEEELSYGLFGMQPEVEDKEKEYTSIPAVVSGDIEMTEATRIPTFGGGEFSFDTKKKRKSKKMVDRALDESKPASRFMSASSDLGQSSRVAADSPMFGRGGFGFGAFRESEEMVDRALDENISSSRFGSASSGFSQSARVAADSTMFGSGGFSFGAVRKSESEGMFGSASSGLSHSTRVAADSPVFGSGGFSFGAVRTSESEGMFGSASDGLFSSSPSPVPPKPLPRARKADLSSLYSKPLWLSGKSKEEAGFLQPPKPRNESVSPFELDRSFSPLGFESFRSHPTSSPAAQPSSSTSTSSPPPPPECEDGVPPLGLLKAARGPPPPPPPPPPLCLDGKPPMIPLLRTSAPPPPPKEDDTPLQLMKAAPKPPPPPPPPLSLTGDPPMLPPRRNLSGDPPPLPPRPHPRMSTLFSTLTPFGLPESTPSTSVRKPVLQKRSRGQLKLAMKTAGVKKEQPICHPHGTEPPSSPPYSPTSPAIPERVIHSQERLLPKVELDQDKHVLVPGRTGGKGTRSKSSVHIPLQTQGRDTFFEKQKLPRFTPRIEEFFNLQNAEGYWTMDAAVFSSLGLDTNKCIAVLQDAGAMSLGDEVFNEIVRFFATLVMLFLLRSRFPAMFSFPLDPLGKAASGAARQWKEHISKAFCWLQTVDKKNPSLCWRLELGNDWELAANLLHSQCISTNMEAVNTLYYLQPVYNRFPSPQGGGEGSGCTQAME